MKNLQKVIIQDPWDSDIYHLGFVFESKHSSKRIQRTIASIHIDDIEPFFGLDFKNKLDDILTENNDWEYIFINAEFPEDES